MKIHLHFPQPLLFLSVLLPFAACSTNSSTILFPCPKILEKWCSCEEYSIGLYIKCTEIQMDLHAIINTVQNLRIAQLTIEQVDWPEIKPLPNATIRSLRLNKCGIKTVAPNAFRNIAEHLEEVQLSNNSISTTSSFGKMPKLISLELSYNNLEDISENLTENMVGLRNLRLRGNNICSLTKKALNTTKDKLELLDLSRNCFSRVPAQNLRNSMNLQYLDLSDNKIREISNFELMNLPQLREISLNGNTLKGVAQMAFMNVPKLQYLYLQDNSLSTVEPRLFQVFKNLEVLDLSNNNLSKIPILKELPNIRQVRLDHNIVESIDTLAFSSNPNLQLISLQNNKIRSISRNSFDSLEQLSVLLLNNNSITSIDQGMLDGMKNLQQLSIKNNSLTDIGNKTFNSVPMLTLLDLSDNQLEALSNNIFDSLQRLYWLDLSHNKLTSFKKGTFKNKIGHILLHGNQLVCNESINWFVKYLVTNHVRTFLPFQPEIVCSPNGPNGATRLKELMIKTANETMNAQNNANLQTKSSQNLLYNLLPSGLITGLKQDSSRTGMQANEPGLQNFDSVPNGYGREPTARSIGAVLKSMPNTVMNVPGLGNIDISQLPPSVIDHVLNGGQIPGIPKETLNKLIAEYTKRMQAAAQAQARNSDKSQQNVNSYVVNNSIISAEQDNEKQKPNYNTPVTMIRARTNVTNDSPAELANAINIPPQLLQLIKLLPPNYDITKIPSEVMQAVSRNEIPNFGLLPTDLQQHLVNNIQNVVSAFGDKQNVTIDEILRKLPKFDRPTAPTFAPYNIDDVRNDLIHTKDVLKKQRQLHLYTAVLLSLVGVVSAIVIMMLCVYMKRKRLAALDSGLEEDSLVNTFQLPPPQAASSPKNVVQQLPPYVFSNLAQKCTLNDVNRQYRYPI